MWIKKSYFFERFHLYGIEIALKRYTGVQLKKYRNTIEILYDCTSNKVRRY